MKWGRATISTTQAEESNPCSGLPNDWEIRGGRFTLSSGLGWYTFERTWLEHRLGDAFELPAELHFEGVQEDQQLWQHDWWRHIYFSRMRRDRRNDPLFIDDEGRRPLNGAVQVHIELEPEAPLGEKFMVFKGLPTCYDGSVLTLWLSDGPLFVHRIATPTAS